MRENLWAKLCRWLAYHLPRQCVFHAHCRWVSMCEEVPALKGLKPWYEKQKAETEK